MFSIFREYFWPRNPQPQSLNTILVFPEILFASADFNDDYVHAVLQILNAAYQVEITVRSSSTLIHFLLERMKQVRK